MLGGAFNCTTACMGKGRLIKYGGSSLTSLTWIITRWLSVSEKRAENVDEKGFTKLGLVWDLLSATTCACYDDKEYETRGLL